MTQQRDRERGSQGSQGQGGSSGGRGFGSMPDDEQREIARQGGKAAARRNDRDDQGQFTDSGSGSSGGGSGSSGSGSSGGGSGSSGGGSGSSGGGSSR
jgi:hypothetical protein